MDTGKDWRGNSEESEDEEVASGINKLFNSTNKYTGQQGEGEPTLEEIQALAASIDQVRIQDPGREAIRNETARENATQTVNFTLGEAINPSVTRDGLLTQKKNKSQDETDPWRQMQFPPGISNDDRVSRRDEDRVANSRSMASGRGQAPGLGAYPRNTRPVGVQQHTGPGFTWAGMSIHTAIKYIPDFDGRPENLDYFINTIREMVGVYGPGSQGIILKVLPQKMKKLAARVMGSSAASYTNIEEFFEDLIVQFGDQEDEDLVRIELRQAEQEEGESAARFGQRVQALEEKLKKLCVRECNDAWSRETTVQKISRNALHSFLSGLRNPREYKVTTYNPRTLREAIRIAGKIEMEQKIKNKRVSSPTATRQRATNRQVAKVQFDTDTEEENSSTSEENVNTIANLLMKLLPQTANARAVASNKAGYQEPKSQGDTGRPLYCKVCKRAGHDLNSCFKIQNALERGETVLELGPKTQYPNQNQYQRQPGFPPYPQSPRNFNGNPNQNWNNGNFGNSNQNGGVYRNGYRNNWNRRYNNDNYNNRGDNYNNRYSPRNEYGGNQNYNSYGGGEYQNSSQYRTGQRPNSPHESQTFTNRNQSQPQPRENKSGSNANQNQGGSLNYQ